MALDNDSDHLGTRIGKSMRGIPNEMGVTDSQMGLKLLQQQTAAMKDMGRALAVRSNTPAQPNIQVAAPEIHIDIPDASEALKPQFDSLISKQSELAESVRDLGYIGDLSLRQLHLLNHSLAQLNQEQRAAFEQRNKALTLLASSYLGIEGALKSGDGKLGTIVDETRRSNALLTTGVTEHRESNKQLRVGNALAEEGNSNLSGINMALATGNQLAAAGNNLASLGNNRLERIEGTLIACLGEIGVDISDLSSQLIASTMAIVDQLRSSQDIFMWAHREQTKYFREILFTLRHPVQARSLDLWVLGEKARIAGHPEHAKKLYENSLLENPTLARSYYSLGLLALKEETFDVAESHFRYGIDYSRGEPKLQSIMLLLLAKMERMKNNLPNALILAEYSHASDKFNLETWYELALVHTLSGHDGKALFYLQNLLRAARRAQSPFLQKVLATPAFFKFINEITSFTENQS